MTRFKAGRTRLSGLLVLGAVALPAFSGLAIAHGHHGDRHRHGQDSGQISSFDSGTGVLAIELTGGDTVSGLVTEGTKIRCEDEHAPDASTHGRGGEHGDDNGGQGNEPGDDSGPGPSHSGPSGHGDNGAGANCTESDLVVGATVHEAELDLRNGKAIFGEVELAG